jgi:superfamily II DNA or RNA helicase
MRLTLDQIQVGTRLSGLSFQQLVTVSHIERHGESAATIIYKEDSGQIGERILFSHELSGIELAQQSSKFTFDGDAEDFKLAAEALRIKYAALYDPLIAVNSSDLQPLPHQIRAVYGELLPRVPLRFLLADDPGAGKTIMAGLYIKELRLRGDLERCLIVAPGGLVEQWQEELNDKFELKFEILTKQHLESTLEANIFDSHPMLIARMDQLSRADENVTRQLKGSSWDLVVVDEAHRMSAHFSSWGGDIKETKRFTLGKNLSEIARNLLLMTATPHAGNEEDFQLFMSLLDADRFEGKFRDGVHKTVTDGLMRRMVKEDLLTFEGKPLFPERIAETVEYALSEAEQNLYEEVTNYVRVEMNRADAVSQAGDKKRGNNIGFALTILQRRLASSPEAILRSLERRQERLELRVREFQRVQEIGAITGNSYLESDISLDFESFDDYDEELSASERESIEERLDEVVDLATAARSVDELNLEIQVLKGLVTIARRVRHLDIDKKWTELSSLLQDNLLRGGQDGRLHKIIVFTEHKDTLRYLQEKIVNLLGRDESVVTIHGGTKRQDRKLAQEKFTEDPNVLVLVATDAAGEGLNLQRAHLMVNYDLPWNPNRIEQRFGRIHRIGQDEVCRLWNLVAANTREGEVFARLLQKIEQQGKAYNGNLFNVLGEGNAFRDMPLRSLMIEAIRYGNDPLVRERLNQIIDDSVTLGLSDLLEERALHPEMFNKLDIDGIKKMMEAAQERRLQPGFIKSFFTPAFERLGGKLREREPDRFEIARVPARIRDHALEKDRRAPVVDNYERVTFRRELKKVLGRPNATLLAPGHPLLDAVIDLTIEDLGDALQRGTIFVDSTDKQRSGITTIYAVEQKVLNAAQPPMTVDRHFDFIEIDGDSEGSISNMAPYLDFSAPTAIEARQVAELVASLRESLTDEGTVRRWAVELGASSTLQEKKLLAEQIRDKTRLQILERLNKEINHWDTEHNRLLYVEDKGKSGSISAATAFQRARHLEVRRDNRVLQLEREASLLAVPPLVRAAAIVVPSRLLESSVGFNQDPASFESRKLVERRAIELVLASERLLGREPTEMPQNNRGFDIKSLNNRGEVTYLEVKGRIEGSETFTVTASEISFAQTQGASHRLALVSVSPNGTLDDEVRYLTAAFDSVHLSQGTASINFKWSDYWSTGRNPN